MGQTSYFYVNTDFSYKLLLISVVAYLIASPPYWVNQSRSSYLAPTMDYSRMDRKRSHVTCGNWLAIERKESCQKFASFEEELHLLCLGLLGASKTSSCGSFFENMTPAQ